jgi:hypothetical protein
LGKAIYRHAEGKSKEKERQQLPEPKQLTFHRTPPADFWVVVILIEKVRTAGQILGIESLEDMDSIFLCQPNRPRMRL